MARPFLKMIPDVRKNTCAARAYSIHGHISHLVVQKEPRQIRDRIHSQTLLHVRCQPRHAAVLLSVSPFGVAHHAAAPRRSFAPTLASHSPPCRRSDSCTCLSRVTPPVSARANPTCPLASHATLSVAYRSCARVSVPRSGYPLPRPPMPHETQTLSAPQCFACDVWRPSINLRIWAALPRGAPCCRLPRSTRTGAMRGGLGGSSCRNRVVLQVAGKA